tara:strand:+ start:1457 stop:1951 length:495 start_codon:yes stop_codon:yes gene_type:complete
MDPITAIYISLQITVVAWFDFKTRKISNLWTILNLALYLLFPFILPEVYSFKLSTWFVPLSFILVGFILFKIDVMGAGDSKYLFSLFLIIPQAKHEQLLMTLLNFTAIIGCTLLIWRLVRNAKQVKLIVLTGVGSFKDILGSKFTYAPVIMVSWFWFLYNVGVK